MNHRSTKDGPWCWANRDALATAAKLGIPALAAYVALIQCESMAASDQKGRFPASLDQLSMLGAVGRETVKRGLKLLVAQNLVSVVSGTNAKGVRTRNRYRLNAMKSKALTEPTMALIEPIAEALTEPTNKEKETISPPALRQGGRDSREKKNFCTLTRPLPPRPLEGGSAGAHCAVNEKADTPSHGGSLEAVGNAAAETLESRNRALLAMLENTP